MNRWSMILDDLIIASQLREKLICKVKTEALVQNVTLFAIDTTPRGLYFNGSIHNGPIYKSRAECSAHEAY